MGGLKSIASFERLFRAGTKESLFGKCENPWIIVHDNYPLCCFLLLGSETKENTDFLKKIGNLSCVTFKTKGESPIEHKSLYLF